MYFSPGTKFRNGDMERKKTVPLVAHGQVGKKDMEYDVTVDHSEC